MKADYIVVGGGSAGCVVAARLSEDPTVSVILIEAGGHDRHWHFAMPLAWQKAVMNPKVSWNYLGEPEPHLNQRQLPVPRGKVLGGCSSINGMMYARGHRSDYDGWADLGLAGWSFADVLPYFRSMESHWRGQTSSYGGEGPLAVSRLHDLEQPITRELLASARHLGLPVLDDFQTGDGLGFSVPDFTIYQGQRSSTSRRFLQPALTRRNLQVITGAQATRILMTNKRAVGVECRRGGETLTVECNRELLLTAGAINSPQLLQLSGIGAGEELQQLGIDVQHHLPGVGRNLQEHTTIICTDELAAPLGFEAALRFDRLALSVSRWFINRGGSAGSVPFGAQGFLPLSDDPSRPGMQIIFTPVSKQAYPWFPGLRKGEGHQLTTVGVQMHPKSRGHVSLASNDPLAAPKILHNMLAHEDDRAAMREIVRFKRKLLGTEPICSLLARELVPGQQVESDEALDRFIREQVGTSFHPVGTCAMGVDADAVVDARLKVRGVERLRVIDASVMPLLPSGNTNIPTIMIAEKAVDMIRQEAAG